VLPAVRTSRGDALQPQPPAPVHQRRPTHRGVAGCASGLALTGILPSRPTKQRAVVDCRGMALQSRWLVAVAVKASPPTANAAAAQPSGRDNLLFNGHKHRPS